MNPSKDGNLVRIGVDRNKLRLQLPRTLSPDGKQKYIALGLDDTPLNRQVAEQKRLQLELDILSGNFDFAEVDKYRAVKTQDKVMQVIDSKARKRKAQLEADLALIEVSSSKEKDLLPLWDAWIKTLDPNPSTHYHYGFIRKMIKASKSASTLNHQWLLASELSASTFNHRLSLVKAFGDWLREEKFTTTNPYTKIKRRADKDKAEIIPFTLEEIVRIIEAFDTNSVCPKTSCVKHSFYADYVFTFFATGCRPSELIGLQWKHIDFEKETLTIRTALARDSQGRASGNRRVRKETKTNNVRILSCKGTLKERLLNRKPEDCSPEDLVFPAPKGGPIDDTNFRDRQWKTVLKALDIEYRKPYTVRHTLLSHAIEQGMPITQVAYLAGHKNTRMVSTTYGHMINRPDLPNLYQGK